jgi:hypothetical protein
MIVAVTEHDPWLQLLDAGRIEEAGAARSRRRWLEAAAAEGATLAGVLVDLAERRADVVLGTGGGAVLSGTVVGVGADVVVLDRRTGPLHLIPLREVATLRVDGALPLGDRPAPDAPHLVDLLARSGEREEVVVLRLTDRTTVSGVVEVAGRDVVRVRPEDPALGATYVSVTSIGEAAVFRSG